MDEDSDPPLTRRGGPSEEQDIDIPESIITKKKKKRSKKKKKEKIEPKIEEKESQEDIAPPISDPVPKISVPKLTLPTKLSIPKLNLKNVVNTLETESDRTPRTSYSAFEPSKNIDADLSAESIFVDIILPAFVVSKTEAKYGVLPTCRQKLGVNAQEADHYTYNNDTRVGFLIKNPSNPFKLKILTRRI